MIERHFRLSGPVLYLAHDASTMVRQLQGEHLPAGAAVPLLDDVSTDEIAPAWACYYTDETLGRYCLCGLRGGGIGTDAIAKGGFRAVVAGRSMGCGSSRETAPYALLAAGVEVVFAHSIEKIFLQNAQNIGLLVSSDFDLLERLRAGQWVDVESFTRGLDPVSADVVRQGGLFAYNRERTTKEPSCVQGSPRGPATVFEKIIGSHLAEGSPPPEPGGSAFVRADVRFTHDYVTAMAATLFHMGFGPEARVLDPQSVYAFRDHLTLLPLVMPRAHRDLGLDIEAAKLATRQKSFAEEQGIRLFDDSNGSTPGICHNVVLEEIALPGQVILGSDSHTCTAGALGCVALGVGATDMANAWKTGDARLRWAPSVRVVLSGRLRSDVCAKDLMLHLLSNAFFRGGSAIGRVLEFSGEGVSRLSVDDRATLTNMSVEGGALTGIVEADETAVRYIAESRGLSPQHVRSLIVRSDEGASYEHTIEVLLDGVEPMVATPGDPRNGVTIGALQQLHPAGIPIDIAYGGSCTGAKRSDMDLYAKALAGACARGRQVHPRVRFYIQFGSQRVHEYARARGYLEIFEGVGAILLEPSCGACIQAGPGTSTRSDQITISAISRNFPGRSGPGLVYLAGPHVVAASALAGTITCDLDPIRVPASSLP